MFQRIMAPVDLAHLDRLERALAVTADAARHYGCPVTYVSVAAATPGKLAHNPEEFRELLAAFADKQAERHGIETAAHAKITHDPAIDMDDALVAAVEETGADLVIMASHKPNLADYFWSSNGGNIATHTDVSVMLVRDA